VETADTGDFYELPLAGAEAMSRLLLGQPLHKIQQDLEQDFPEEEIDLTDFIGQLVELELVREIDGNILIPDSAAVGTPSAAFAHSKPAVPSAKRGKGDWVSPRIARILFNRWTFVLFACFFAVNMVLFVLRPELIPRPSEIFIFRSMALNSLVWMGLSMTMGICHELGHYLAARAEGLPAKIGYGNRMFFLVLETDLTAAWALPSRKRNRLFLAGLCVDHTILLGLLVARFWGEWSPVAGSVLAYMTYSIILGTIFQCLFYMKTDVYYLLENITGTHNLMENAKARLRINLPWQRQQKNAEAVVFPGEEKTIEIYKFMLVSGIMITGLAFIFYMLPQTFIAFRQACRNLRQPLSSLYFWDGVVFMVQAVGFTAMLLYSRVRNAAGGGRNRRR
jgi:hypothetical protein